VVVVVMIAVVGLHRLTHKSSNYNRKLVFPDLQCFNFVKKMVKAWVKTHIGSQCTQSQAQEAIRAAAYIN
jgi:hypothetical protein